MNTSKATKSKSNSTKIAAKSAKKLKKPEIDYGDEFELIVDSNSDDCAKISDDEAADENNTSAIQKTKKTVALKNKIALKQKDSDSVPSKSVIVPIRQKLPSCKQCCFV